MAASLGSSGGSGGSGASSGNNPGSQYFSLRWNNHPVNLVSVFTGLYQVRRLKMFHYHVFYFDCSIKIEFFLKKIVVLDFWSHEMLKIEK